MSEGVVVVEVAFMVAVEWWVEMEPVLWSSCLEHLCMDWGGGGDQWSGRGWAAH